ncbi:hypothetical protein CBR_g8358 [Chara braunii]|uniref:Uncharacterized protein n=1 Tax=Chara braunii TaxID=69332 RepID=A0A388KLY4_CHABU|nr:hypothetical protein CBR_g8358 [Chara braunii]|eukprot:GBG71059.1 hypothetical protein CBR_g8358 [Chara braunii]
MCSHQDFSENVYGCIHVYILERQFAVGARSSDTKYIVAMVTIPPSCASHLPTEDDHKHGLTCTMRDEPKATMGALADCATLHANPYILFLCRPLIARI